MEPTLLLIESEPMRAHRLSDALSRAGFDLRLISDPEAAMAAARDIRPSKILIDGGSREVDAPAMVRRFAAAGQRAEIFVIASGDDAIACYENGAAAVFPSSDSETAISALAARIARPCPGADRDGQELNFRRVKGMLEDERFITVNQVLDNISLIIEQISDEVEGGVKYFTQMPYFVSVHDRNQNVIIANAAYRKLLGNKIGRKSWEIYRMPWANPDDCPVGKTLQTEQVQETRAVVKYRSGLRVPVIVHTAPIYSNDGSLELVLEVSAGTRDVRRLSKELRRSQQRYQQLFNAVPCYVAVVNRDLRITAVNRPFREDFGDHTGRRFFQIFEQPPGPGVDPISRTLDDARPHEAEMALHKSDGKRYNALVWTSPITTAAGKLLQILVMFVDITQIRQLKDNLSYLGLMMGTIAHGIKGVLTGLNGGLYLIESACRRQHQEKVEEGIAISRQMMQRMEQVVFNILYYTKKRSLTLETVEADPFAADLAGEFEPKIDSSRISFRVELDALGASLEADATMLRAALTNILENAVDACAADTEKKSHQIVFRVEQHDGQIRFDIQDDGPGMDTETRKKLFDLFYSTKGSKGTGLGMFIADKIIRQHGGRIRVESEPGKGTRFTVDLPRRIPDVLRQYRTDQIRDFEL
ncbi:MAG: PAS domain-containing protein [Desulfobacterales bacterium]|nr:PAS domain-containing protein [Desulfobacterales bacterium]